MKYLQNSKRVSYFASNDRSYQLYNLAVHVNTKLYNHMGNIVKHDLFTTLYEKINTTLHDCLKDRVHE